MEPSQNPDRKNPTEVIHDPVSGAGGFLAAGGGSLWFTPPHIMAIIDRETAPAFLLANPPFGRPADSR